MAEAQGDRKVAVKIIRGATREGDGEQAHGQAEARPASPLSGPVTSLQPLQTLGVLGVEPLQSRYKPVAGTVTFSKRTDFFVTIR